SAIAPPPISPQQQANPLQQQQQQGQQQTPGAGGKSGTAGTAGTPSAAAKAGGAGATGAKPVAANSIDQSLTPNTAVSGAQAVNSAIAQNPGAATDQSTRQRLLVPPQAQSTLYAELLKKHE